MQIRVPVRVQVYWKTTADSTFDTVFGDIWPLSAPGLTSRNGGPAHVSGDREIVTVNGWGLVNAPADRHTSLCFNPW